MDQLCNNDDGGSADKDDDDIELTLFIGGSSCLGRAYVNLLLDDNTIQRMAPYRLSLLLDKKIDRGLKGFLNSFNLLIKLVNQYTYSARKENRQHFNLQNYGELQENITRLRRALYEIYKTVQHFV